MNRAVEPDIRVFELHADRLDDGVDDFVDLAWGRVNRQTPRIGEIVLYHVNMPPAIFSREDLSSEEIVHYADKRVLHDTIVSLSERFEDLILRYGKTPDARTKLKTLEEQTYRIEEKIFARIDFSPEDLPDRIGE